MKRRTLVILVSLCVLVGVVVIGVLAVGVGVSTRAGREQIRQLAEAQLGRALNGKVYIGRISGGLLSGVTIDTFAIRGADDSLWVSTGRLTLDYNPRDLMDRRVLIRNATIEHPVMRLEKFPNGDWNHYRLFRRPPSNRPRVPGRSMGDFVVIDSVTIKNGEFSLIRGWSPPDSLTGARRDSAIRVALADSTIEIRKSSSGYTRTLRWKQINAFLPHVRFNHPDSSALGREFIFERANVVEMDPPFVFSNARGVVRHQGDSIFIDLPHFDLPASSGSATGKVFWGGGLPDRWDVRIRADSVALKDVAWTYPTLPKIGGGPTKLHIHNSVDNLNVMEYALTEMDVRTGASRMSGAMTFVIGNPVLGIKDVNLRFAPLNFDVIRTLSGGPFPVDWQGDLIGMAQGPGGPLTNFKVDTANITWRDTHVKGAISRFTGRGELDILQPDSTKFHGFQVATEVIDLRSIQYLFPGFPRIGGTIAGSATLDSSWLDVRFSNADITHTNGPENPSRLTGKGRVTYGERYMSYDVDLDAKPVSMPQMSRAYDLGLTGYLSGPIKARGTSPRLRVSADLKGAGGRFTYDGIVDVDGMNVGARGAGRVETLQLGELIAGYKAPAAWLTGDYKVDVAFDTNDVGTTKGSMSMNIERSEFGETRLFASRAYARFSDRRMFVDTLRIESTAARVDAAGAIGLTKDRSDTIHYRIDVDSLGGLRSYAEMFLKRAQGAAPDSLSGSVAVRGFMYGSLPTFQLNGSVDGERLVMRRDLGQSVAGTFDVTNPFTAPTGSLYVRSKTLTLGGVGLDTAGLSVRLNEGKTGAFALGAREINGTNVLALGEFARSDSSTLVNLRSVALNTDGGRWLMSGNSAIRFGGGQTTIDSLVLLSERGGRVALTANVPESGKANVTLHADSLPLRDVGLIAQLKTPMSGFATMVVTGTGTRFAPVINAEARLSSIAFGSMRLDGGTARMGYDNNRADVLLDLSKGQRSVMQVQGSLPVALNYFGGALIEDSLKATVRTAGASLDLVQALIPGMRDATGNLLANVDVGGTWSHPDVSGSISVANGEATLDQLGIRLRGIQVDLGLFGHADSLAVRRFVGWNGASSADSVSLSGYVSYKDFSNPYLNLRLDARQFFVIDKRALARLYVSTERGGLALRGQLQGAGIEGGIVVDRGQVFLPDPELTRKQGVDIRAQFADTASRNRSVLLDSRSKFLDLVSLRSVRVTLGDEVSLQSPEADIHLSGSLVATTRPTRIPSLSIEGVDTIRNDIVYDGTLRADRGTYTLNLFEGYRRTFEVQSGGTITFYPTTDLPEDINITAVNVVKRASQADLRIRVHLTGSLDNQVVALESGEAYAISQTDLVAYLVFGVPAFELADRQTKTVTLALNNIIPTALSGITAALNRRVGGVNFQILPGAVDYSGGLTGSTFTSLLATTRVGGEMQLTDRTFFSLSTGLCQLSGQTGDNGESFDVAKSLSGKLEYRFNPTTALKAGVEPATKALTCGGNQTGRAFIPAPPQWGLQLSKSWRF